MRRSITGYHQDDANDWVAELSCGHGQHVRHKPPFLSRPWVVTPEGRASMLGTELDACAAIGSRCPTGWSRTSGRPISVMTPIPAGLRKNHSTKPGVWGMIHVISGGSATGSMGSAAESSL